MLMVGNLVIHIYSPSACDYALTITPTFLTHNPLLYSHLSTHFTQRWLIDFFYWLFRKGWFTIFAVALVMFYLLVIFFGALITWAAVMDSDCIRIGDNPFEGTATRSLAAQAFALSWHTFSTVGYGSTYPALSTQHNHNNDVRCAFINFICPIEALIGVM